MCRCTTGTLRSTLITWSSGFIVPSFKILYLFLRHLTSMVKYVRNAGVNVKELFDLTGKVAVVTGGAGGIGEVYAKALCEAGASVVIADINLEAAQRFADELTGVGSSALAVELDVTSAESVTRMASAATDAFGGIDILINNAAVMT